MDDQRERQRRECLRHAEALSLAGDAEALSAYLADLDARDDLTPSNTRFVTAVRAMGRGQYECAAAAWSDAGGPGCWIRTEDDPDTVPSGAAAAAMAATCLEVVGLRERVAELESALWALQPGPGPGQSPCRSVPSHSPSQSAGAFSASAFSASAFSASGGAAGPSAYCGMADLAARLDRSAM